MWRWISKKLHGTRTPWQATELLPPAEARADTLAASSAWADTQPMPLTALSAPRPAPHRPPLTPPPLAPPASGGAPDSRAAGHLAWVATVPMSLLPLPDDGAPEREAELRRLAALQARGETAYQYVVDTAARICQTPVAAIALLDGDSLWIKASVGLSVERTPAAGSPCREALARSPATTVLDDLAADARFSAHPLVAAPRGFRYYAGTPLVTSQGVAIGTVYVADFGRRELSLMQLRTLQLLARQAALLLEARAA